MSLAKRVPQLRTLFFFFRLPPHWQQFKCWSWSLHKIQCHIIRAWFIKSVPTLWLRKHMVLIAWNKRMMIMVMTRLIVLLHIYIFCMVKRPVFIVDELLSKEGCTVFCNKFPERSTASWREIRGWNQGFVPRWQKRESTAWDHNKKCENLPSVYINFKCVTSASPSTCRALCLLLAFSSIVEIFTMRIEL